MVAARAAHAAALIVQQRVDLVNAIIDELVRQRYELPAYSTLENIADVVASSGKSKLMSLVDSRLRHSTRVGAAQDLAELDIDLVAITQAAGLKSVQDSDLYVRQAPVFTCAKHQEVTDYYNIYCRKVSEPNGCSSEIANI